MNIVVLKRWNLVLLILLIFRFHKMCGTCLIVLIWIYMHHVTQGVCYIPDIVQSLNVKFSWSFIKITSKGFWVDMNYLVCLIFRKKCLPKLLLRNCLKIWLIKRGYLCLSGPENGYLKIYKCVNLIFLIR